MNTTNIKTALVTGASSGMGYELAKLFANDKYRVILVSRTESDLEQVKKELIEKYSCPEVFIIPKDLSVVGSASELFNEIKQKYKLDINFLINAAGTAKHGKICDIDIEIDLQMIQINIVSVIELTKLILPEMIQRNDGRILMFGAISTAVAGPLIACYAATKAFICNYTDALIDELKETNVTATLLMAGLTDTNIFKTMGAENTNAANSSSMDDPADVAKRAYDALMKGEHRVYGSMKVKLLIGLGQVLPNELTAKAAHYLLDEKK